MRRLLLLLPIALIISIAILPPCLVSADYFSFAAQATGAHQQTLSGPGDFITAFSAADNDLSLIHI